MLRHKRYMVKIILFCALLSSCLTAANHVLTPKYFYNGDWPATSTYMDFYQMERNSVDVLFLGSSHCVAAFSPIELYEKYGIRSYNLGCEQQNLLLSYYWLKEALRWQKPKYVFLDTFMLFPYDVDSVLNSSEPAVRKAVDFMRWSFVKLEAVRDICSIDKNQSFFSYVFPNERFHSRWRGLSENDFSVKSMGEHMTLMGFSPIDFQCGIDSFQPFCQTSQAEYAEMVPVMKEYLDRMVELCAEEDIVLVLTKTPSMFYSQGAYNTVRAYALEKGIDYLDFNEEGLYGGAGLDFSHDSSDTDHVSAAGAVKISDYIGGWLSDKVPCGLKDRHWEDRALYYEHDRKDEYLKQETDLKQYLQLLQDESYAVLIAVQGDASEIFQPAGEELQGLGLNPALAAESGYGYCAVIDGSRLSMEEAGRGLLRRQGTVRKGLTTWQIVAGGSECGNACSILVNGDEASMQREGLNIAVYCKEEKKLIDRVCFYVEEGEIRAVR